MEELGRRCAAAAARGRGGRVRRTPSTSRATSPSSRPGGWGSTRPTARSRPRSSRRRCRSSASRTAATTRQTAEFPLDWGTEVPLAFVGAPRVVVVAPARDRPLEEHLRLGEAIAALPGRVALIASADNGHAHDAGRALRLRPGGSGVRRALQEILDVGPPRLPARSPSSSRPAKADSLWQLLVLQGALEETAERTCSRTRRRRTTGCWSPRFRPRRRSRHSPGTPLSACTPRSSNARPEPATRSLTVCETSTSPGPASEAIARAGVDGDAADLRAVELALAGVDARRGSRRRAAGRHRRIASAQRTARAGPSKVARKPSPAVSTSRPRKRSSSRRTAASWALEQLAPAAVAELDGPLGRADDVGEEDGGQHAVGLRVPAACRSGTPRSRRRSRRRSPAEIQWSSPGQLDELRARDPGGEVAALRDVDVVVAGAVEHERRHLDRGEDVPDVDVRVHAQRESRQHRGSRLAGGTARGSARTARRRRGSARSTRRPPVAEVTPVAARRRQPPPRDSRPSAPRGSRRRGRGASRSCRA